MILRNCMIYLISFFLLISCGKEPDSTSERVVVGVSIFPLYDIAYNIAGDRAEPFFLIPVGANPHSFEPSPSIVKKLQEVTLYIGVLKEFDGWVEKFIPGDAPIRYLEDENRANPHLWLSVKRAKGIAEQIAKFLSDVDQRNADYYKKNLQKYLTVLDRTDAEIADLFSEIKVKKFIQWHPAWDYLARDYGLTIAGTIQSGHGDEPSVKQFHKIVEVAQREGITVVVIGLKLQSSAANSLVREIGGKLIRLDSIGDPKRAERSTYASLMLHNARVLSESLKQ